MASRIYTAGQLNQLVQFQVRADGQNELNEADGDWINDGPVVWASVQPLRGAERLQAGALQQPVDTLIVIRHSSTRPASSIMSRGLRLLWKGQPHDISAALAVDGGSEWIEISATAGIRDGR